MEKKTRKPRSFKGNKPKRGIPVANAQFDSAAWNLTATELARAKTYEVLDLKLWAEGKALHKANYWLQYIPRLGRFKRSREAALLNERNERAYEWVLDAAARFIAEGGLDSPALPIRDYDRDGKGAKAVTRTADIDDLLS